VVGNHWSVLVLGTFGVGVGLWLCAVLFIFAGRLPFNPYEWTGFLFVYSACCQVAAGLAMLSINRGVKAYFLTEQGKEALARAGEVKMGGDVIGLVSDKGPPSLML